MHHTNLHTWSRGDHPIVNTTSLKFTTNTLEKSMYMFFSLHLLACLVVHESCLSTLFSGDFFLEKFTLVDSECDWIRCRRSGRNFDEGG